MLKSVLLTAALAAAAPAAQAQAQAPGINWSIAPEGYSDGTQVETETLGDPWSRSGRRRASTLEAWSTIRTGRQAASSFPKFGIGVCQRLWSLGQQVNDTPQP